MIHFQYHESDATLRASELKPKFDKFLSNKVDGGLFHKGALPYSVTIYAENGVSAEPLEYIELDKYNQPGRYKKAIPTFFGNMGEAWRKNPKQFVSSNDGLVKVDFFAKNSALLKKIIEHFEEFIFTHNFGMRQSKGFGSFEVIDCTSASFIKKSTCKDFEKVKFSFTVNLDDESFRSIYPPKVDSSADSFRKYGKLFEILNTFSKTYRSGLNVNGYYFKSLMYMYIKNDYTWDKKYFKSIFVNDEVLAKENRKHGFPKILNFKEMKQEYLFRDLLGLSTNQTWYNYKLKIAHDKENTIVRFKSPVTYKIER